MRFGEIRRRGDRLTDQLDRTLGTPVAERDHPEQVKCVGVVGLLVEYLAAERRGALEPSGLMVRERR